MTYEQGFLIVLSGILLVGLLGQWLFQRTAIPDAIWLILVGIAIGPVLGWVRTEELRRVEPVLGAITLAVVLFHGGLGLPLHQLITHAWQASKLALLTFLASVAGVALTVLLGMRLGLLVDGWSWTLAVLTGLILGGSSSVVVMATLGFAKVEHELAQPLNVESALTDVLVVVCTGVMVELLIAGQMTASAPFIGVARNFGVGIAVGTFIGLFLLLFIRALTRGRHAYVFLLALMLMLYAVASSMGGSAALAVLAAAVVIGNAGTLLAALGFQSTERRLVLSNTSLRLSEFTLFIVKSLFFTFIGASLSLRPEPLLLGAVLGAVLLFVRLPAVRLALADSRLTEGQKDVAWIAVPRGLAAGVMALSPVAAGIPGAELLPETVFAAIVTTILLFSIGFAFARRRLAVAPSSGTMTGAGAG